MEIDYLAVSKWAILVFLISTVINVAADWLRKTRNLGLFSYVGILAAAVAIWATNMNLAAVQEEAAAAAAAAAAKPEFPTVEIDDRRTPSKMD